MITVNYKWSSTKINRTVMVVTKHITVAYTIIMYNEIDQNKKQKLY